MVTVPGFLLRRLYVKDTLKNTNDGFQFELRNRLGSGYALRVHPVKVDGVEVPIESTSFDLDGEAVAFADVSSKNTLALAMNKAIVIRVVGTRLDGGPRKIGMGFDVPGLGMLSFRLHRHGRRWLMCGAALR